MRVKRGSRGIKPLILNLGTRWKWMGNFTPCLPYTQEITPVLFDYKAGCRQSRSGRFWRRQNSLITQEPDPLENSRHPTHPPPPADDILNRNFQTFYLTPGQLRQNIPQSLLTQFQLSFQYYVYSVKITAVPLQAWKGPEVSKKLRSPDFVTTEQDGGRLSASRTGRL